MLIVPRGTDLIGLQLQEPRRELDWKRREQNSLSVEHFSVVPWFTHRTHSAELSLPSSCPCC